MFGETGIEGGVSVGFARAVFEQCWEGGEEEGRAVDEGFGALGD